MAFLKKLGSTASDLVAGLLGGGKAPKLGTTQTQAEAKAAAEERQREELGSYLEITQHKGRKIQQDATGRHYGNVNPIGRGEAPDLESFLYGETYSRFASSNVEAIAYDITQQQLYVRFQGGRWYRYDAVTKQEAGLFWAGYSKGTMVWDILRIRGTKDGHRKSYTRDAAPPDYLPLSRNYPLETYGQGGAAQDVLRGVSQNPIT